jgi:hypothetical protein
MSKAMTRDCYRRRALIAMPPGREVPFLAVAGWLVTPWPKGARITDAMAQELEAVREQIADAGGVSSDAAAWISAEEISFFEPVSAAWIRTKLAHHHRVPVRAPGRPCG